MLLTPRSVSRVASPTLRRRHGELLVARGVSFFISLHDALAGTSPTTSRIVVGRYAYLTDAKVSRTGSVHHPAGSAKNTSGTASEKVRKAQDSQCLPSHGALAHDPQLASSAAGATPQQHK